MLGSSVTSRKRNRWGNSERWRLVAPAEDVEGVVAQSGNAAAQEPARRSGSAGPAEGPVSPTAGPWSAGGRSAWTKSCSPAGATTGPLATAQQHPPRSLTASSASTAQEPWPTWSAWPPASGAREPHRGMHFSDSDVYKVLEAVAWDSRRGLPAAWEEFASEAAGNKSGPTPGRAT